MSRGVEAYIAYLKTFNRVLSLIHINLTLYSYAKDIKDGNSGFMKQSHNILNGSERFRNRQFPIS